MAYFLQRLIGGLALAALPAARAADFSHRQHLALKVACLNCHASALVSTRVEDNNLPRAGSCRGCHGQEFSYAFKQPREFFLARFPHRAHVASPDSCGGCHRGMAEAATTSRANFPVMAECIACHNKILLPDSCVQCHTPGPRLRPETHTRDFVDSHNRPNVKREGCAVCHGQKFTCAGCHQG